MTTRRSRTTLAFALLALFTAACGDVATDPRRAESASQIAGDPIVCTVTYAQLQALAITAFGPGSPNVNSVLGKIQNLQHQLNQGNTAEAKDRAHNIVAFTLAIDDLPGSQADIAAFLNAVYCFAGINIVITDPSSATLLYPTDGVRVIYNADQTAGVKFPAGPVTSPTLIQVETLDSPPLSTLLDQYAGYINITAQSDVANPFAGIVDFEAVVGVCATAPDFLFTQNRLRLGHESPSEGFEITPQRDPAAEGIALNCPNPAPLAAQPGIALESFGGDEEFAFAGGGVGGTVREFSPFAAVDIELESFGGGVGGTVREFLRMRARASLADVTSLNESTCDVFEAPIGSLVNCRPTAGVRTRRGTRLSGAPVSWAVTQGAGGIASNVGGECGLIFAPTVTTATESRGTTSVCWTLGNVGTNTVRATLGIGGDVPAGTYYASPTIDFTATANPPIGITVTSAPVTSVVAGAPIDFAVTVVDKNGDRVFGYTGPLTVSIVGATFADGSTTGSIVATAGLASGSRTVTAAGSGYTIVISAPFVTAPGVAGVVGPFGVTPAAAASIAIVSGNGQAAPAGSRLLLDPTVIVRDTYGNVVPGTSVSWTPTLSSTASVTATVSPTGPNGQASTGWIIGAGANELRAAVAGSDPEIAVYFSATGSSTSSVLNSCPIGGSGDPINDPSKPYAFYVPNPGNKTIESIQLYFSATGKANKPALYEIELTTQSGTFNPAISAPVATRAWVTLRGNASEAAPATFTLTTPIVGATGPNKPPVMVTMRVLNNPDNATIRFNTGPCSPGSSCRPPRDCVVTEVSSPLPYPLGTSYRKSVAMVIKGR